MRWFDIVRLLRNSASRHRRDAAGHVLSRPVTATPALSVFSVTDDSSDRSPRLRSLRSMLSHSPIGVQDFLGPT
jgi:hypothetical protein